MKRSTGYRLLRLWGDWNAIRKGPKAVVKRQVNRQIFKRWPRPGMWR